MIEPLKVALWRVAIHPQTGVELGQLKPAGEEVTLEEFILRADTATLKHDVRLVRLPCGTVEVRAIEQFVAVAPPNWPFPTFLGEELPRQPMRRVPRSTYPDGYPEAPL